MKSTLSPGEIIVAKFSEIEGKKTIKYMKHVNNPVINGEGWRLQRRYCCGQERGNCEEGVGKYGNMEKKHNKKTVHNMKSYFENPLKWIMLMSNKMV